VAQADGRWWHDERQHDNQPGRTRDDRTREQEGHDKRRRHEERQRCGRAGGVGTAPADDKHGGGAAEQGKNNNITIK